MEDIDGESVAGGGSDPPQPAGWRPPVNYQPAEPGWWLATDGLWYSPETPGAPPPPVVPAVAYPVIHQTVYQSQPKSRLAAGLLGIFLGGLGIHRFYLGHVGLGLTMLLISVLSLGVLAVFVGIWGFVEGIVILAGGIRTDKRGIPLQ